MTAVEAPIHIPTAPSNTPQPLTREPSSELRAPSRMFVGLSVLVAALGAFATIVGIFSVGGPGQNSVKTVRGETVTLFGHGIYRHDSLFSGATNRGTDIVILAIGIPLLIAFVVLYRRGSLRGRLLLIGILASFAYVYANMSLGAAYNDLYLVYVALLSASLFGLVLTFRSVDLQMLASRLSPALPRRRPAAFLFAAGIITAFLWLSDVVGPLLQGDIPKHLESYSTSVTYTLDLAIITPACLVAGHLVLRRAALGYLLAFPLIGIIVMLVPGVIVSTISQIAAGVTLTTGEIVGPVTGFVVLGLIAIWLVVALLRSIAEIPPAPIVAQ